MTGDPFDHPIVWGARGESARGFLKEVDISGFDEPLYVGANPTGKLAREVMKDVVIRGEFRDFRL